MAPPAPRLVLDPDRTVVIAQGDERQRVEGLRLPAFEKTPDGTEVWAAVTLAVTWSRLASKARWAVAFSVSLASWPR